MKKIRRSKKNSSNTKLLFLSVILIVLFGLVYFINRTSLGYKSNAAVKNLSNKDLLAISSLCIQQIPRNSNNGEEIAFETEPTCPGHKDSTTDPRQFGSPIAYSGSKYYCCSLRKIQKIYTYDQGESECVERYKGIIRSSSYYSSGIEEGGYKWVIKSEATLNQHKNGSNFCYTKYMRLTPTPTKWSKWPKWSPTLTPTEYIRPYVQQCSEYGEFKYNATTGGKSQFTSYGADYLHNKYGGNWVIDKVAHSKGIYYGPFECYVRI